MKIFLYPSRIKVSNLGDVLINTLLVRELSSLGIVYLDGDNDVLFDLATRGNECSNNIRIVKGIKAFKGKPLFRWINLISLIPKINFVLDPPGSYAESSKKSKSILKFYKYYLRALILRLAHIKVLRLGVSYGNFSPKALKRESKLSRIYGTIALRDEKNYSYLQKNGFSNINLIDDLAYLFHPANFELTKSINLKLNSPYIVLSFRWALDGKIRDDKYFSALARKILEVAKSEKYHEHCFVFSYQVLEDYDAVKELEDLFKKEKLKTQLMKRMLDFNDAVNLYSNADYVWSNRLHVALWAMINGTVSFVITDITKHKKIVNIFKDISLDYLVFDIYDNMPKHITQHHDLADFHEIHKGKTKAISCFLKSFLSK